jgi:hypothetical protein
MSISDHIICVKDAPYNCIGDGITDDTTGVNAAIAAWLSTGKSLYFPPGLYKVTQQLVIDLAPIRYTGGLIFGAGKVQSRIDLSSVTASPACRIECSVGDCFFLKIIDLGFLGAHGTTLQIGKQDYSDPMNHLELNTWVGNTSENNPSCAMELNFVVQSSIKAVCNCRGYTTLGSTALRMRQTQFSNLWISCGNAEKDVHLTAGYNFGNVFIAPDLEATYTSVLIDSVNATKNSFLGGQYNYYWGCFNSQAGALNYAKKGNYGGPGTIKVYGPASFELIE